MSNRTKLLVSAPTLAAVLLIAAIAQRNHKPYDPFPPVNAASGEGTRERKVYGGESPRAAEELRPEPDAPAAPTEPAKITAQNDVPADILGFLEQWRSTLARKDVDAHLRTYAPRLDRFFRQRRVSHAAVRREKERMLRIYPEINRYDIRDVKLESQRGNRAVVTFTKDWDTSGVRRFAGSERQRLRLEKAAGGSWQIKSEEELKVYWVRR